MIDNHYENHNGSVKGFTDKFLKFCNSTVTVIMIILLGYLFLLSIFDTSMLAWTTMISEDGTTEKTMYLTDDPIFHITAIALIIMLGYLIVSKCKKLSPKTLKMILIIVHVAVAIALFACILIFDYMPVNDQHTVLDSADKLVHGDYSPWQSGGKNYIFPWLNSLTLLFALPVYLFGINGSIITIRIFNIGMLLLASYSLYGFCKECGLKSAVASLGFILYLPVSLYIFFVYGNLACMSLSMFSIWMAVRYLNHRRKRDGLFTVAALSIAALYKEHALITMIAIIIVIGVYSITSRCLKQLLWIPVIVLVYFCSGFAVDTTIQTVTGEEIEADIDVYACLYIGITEGERANGWYIPINTFLLERYNYDYDLYNERMKALYQEHANSFWKDPGYVVDFFAKKSASQWNNPTFQSIWNIQAMLIVNQIIREEGEKLDLSSLWIDGAFSNMLFYYIFNLIQSLILFGSLWYFVFDSRKAALPVLLPAITFIGGYIFLFIWEAKAQYTFMFFVMLFPYAATGWHSVITRFKRLVDSAKEKRWYRSGEVIFLACLTGLILLLTYADIKPLNTVFKLGVDDEYYEEYLEQNAYIFEQVFGTD